MSVNSKSTDVFAATNPAFGSLILLSFCEGYKKEAKENVPFSLLLLPLPIILSGDLDSSFKNTNTKTGFYSWIKSNPTLLVGLNDRITESMDFIKPSIEYGLARKVLELQSDGSVCPRSDNVGNYLKESEIINYFNRSERLGVWVGQIKSIKTIYNHLGLQL
jgi:hypothetical protein